MSRSSPNRLIAVAAVLAAAGACGGGSGGAPVDGAAVDARADLPDGGTTPDAPASLTWADVAVEGCASLAGDPPRCAGEVPLELRFTIVAAAPVDGALWEFGDGTPAATELAPTHRYARAGRYDVTLSVRGPGGTAQAHRAMLIDATPAGLGGACDDDDGCAASLGCVCDAASSCPAPLARGLCTAACDTDDECGPGAACALAPGAGDQPWHGRWCLRTCAGDGACGTGLACAPAARPAGGWVEACFPPGVLAPDGGPCRDATGALRDDACASGRCLDLGARGLCAGDCVGGCAPGTTCGALGALGPACLASCAGTACDGDPWLACEAPDPDGALGFTVDGPASPEGYCAPRRCATPDTCGAGTCADRGGASFCVAD